MKYTNNSYVTEDTLKAFNDWLRDIYNVKASFIHPDGIHTRTLYEALTNWRDTNASSRAVINSIPVWIYRLFLTWMKTQYERKIEFGKPDIDDRQIVRSYVINLLDRKPVSNRIDYTTKVYRPTYAARIERRFVVPEGYDGNMSSVRLLVPPEVITWLHRRPYGDTRIEREDLTPASGGPNYVACHPLLRATRTYVDRVTDDGILYDGGYGTPIANLNTTSGYGVPAQNGVNHLTSQLYGNYRTNALLFYQQFVKNGNILMDVIKNRDYVEFICETDNFLVPFMDYDTEENDYSSTDYLVAPKVLVNITYYKRGV